jgi:hypothetical protein
MTEEQICKCSEDERAHFGVKLLTPGEPCKNCKLPTITKEQEAAKKKEGGHGVGLYSLTDNSIEEQESLINALIQEMAIGGKYNKALTEGKFASFSLTGTNDWEDYASSVFRIIMLKELMRISKSVDKLTREIERLNDKND